MASPTWWTWVWVDFGSWWWTGRPGVLWFMGSQRVGHDWATELNWTEVYKCVLPLNSILLVTPSLICWLTVSVSDSALLSQSCPVLLSHKHGSTSVYILYFSWHLILSTSSFWLQTLIPVMNSSKVFIYYGVEFLIKISKSSHIEFCLLFKIIGLYLRFFISEPKNKSLHYNSFVLTLRYFKNRKRSDTWKKWYSTSNLTWKNSKKNYMKLEMMQFQVNFHYFTLICKTFSSRNDRISIKKGKGNSKTNM